MGFPEIEFAVTLHWLARVYVKTAEYVESVMMSDRERWIVYPLLFFAILLASRDKIVQPVRSDFDTVVCERLIIESATGRKLAEIGGTYEDSEAGNLVVYGPVNEVDAITGEPIENRSDSVSDTRRSRKTVHLGADASGGFAEFYGTRSAPTVRVGHDLKRRYAGLVAESNGKLLAPADTRETDFWGASIDWQSLAAEAAQSDQQAAEASGDKSVDSDAAEVPQKVGAATGTAS